MNLLLAWKKVLLFGLFGAVGCLAGWLVGEPYLLIVEAATPAGAGRAPSLISKPAPPSIEPPPPPSEFRDRLNAAGAKTGDIQISLIWFNTNDLDLHCIDPSGFEIFWKPEHRRSPAGGELDVDRNAGCNRLTAEPVENIYWAKGTAPMGRYRVYLDFYQRCSGAPNETTYKINVLHSGERKEFSGTIAREDTAGGGPGRLIYEFQLEPKLELFTPTDFEIAPDRSQPLKVPFAVRRDYYQGKIEVKVENLPPHVTADSVTLQPNQSEGELTLKATSAAVVGKSKIKIVATGDGVSNSADPQLTIAHPPISFSLVTVLAIGVWTALLAVGLCLALLAGQNHYLGKPLFAPSSVPLVMVILGAIAAGFVSGTIGQSLFFVFLSIGVAKLGLVFGWMLLGVLLGWGVSFFIPNLDSKKAALAGLAGGFLGGVVFWIMSYAADLIGRFGGAALLGFCIGLMVAMVEVAFRRAWLEVRFSEREVITVNLGPEPVKVGSDARACTVWARGANPIALRYWIRDSKVHCEEVPTKREVIVNDGDSRTAGNVVVVVRTGSGTEPGAPSRGPAAPALPAIPLPPPIPAPAPPPVSQQPVEPRPALPTQPAPPAPAPAKSMQPDWDDGMPMPIGPPPPARPATASILDIDDILAGRHPAPAPAAKAPAPTPAAPPAPKLPVPAASKPPAPAPPQAAAKPPVPAPSVAKPPVPAPPTPAAPKPPAPAAKPPAPTTAAKPPMPAPKPTVPPVPSAPKPPAPAAATPAASSPKTTDPDACPSCGRKAHGKPGSRYCMVCDRTF